MNRALLITVVCGTMAFSWVSRPLNTQNAADNRSLKTRIPRANPAKYRDIRDGADWQNPYLVVGRDRISVLRSGGDTAAPLLALGDVAAYLEKLPSAAWPYGLVVAVQESSIIAIGDEAPIKRNREKLVRILETAGIRVELWPAG